MIKKFCFSIHEKFLSETGCSNENCERLYHYILKVESDDKAKVVFG